MPKPAGWHSNMATARKIRRDSASSNPTDRLKVFLGDGFAGFPIQRDTVVCGARVPIFLPAAKVAIFVDPHPYKPSLHDSALCGKGIRPVHIPAEWVIERPGPTLRRIEQILAEQREAIRGES